MADTLPRTISMWSICSGRICSSAGAAERPWRRTGTPSTRISVSFGRAPRM